MIAINKNGVTLIRSANLVFIETSRLFICHLFTSEKKAKNFTRQMRKTWQISAYNPKLVNHMEFEALLKDVKTSAIKK